MNASRLKQGLCLAALCSLLPGCTPSQQQVPGRPPSQKQASDGYASPEAVYAHHQTLARSQSMQELLDLYPPKSRPEVVFVFLTYIGAQLGSRDPEARKELDAAIEQHGLTERFQSIPLTSFLDEKGVTERAQKLLEGVDIAALWTDIALVMTERGNSPPKSEAESPPTPLTDLRIDGESATAKSGEAELSFVRVDGRWYLKWRAPRR